MGFQQLEELFTLAITKLRSTHTMESGGQKFLRNSERGENCLDFVFIVFWYTSASFEFVSLLESDFISVVK